MKLVILISLLLLTGCASRKEVAWRPTYYPTQYHCPYSLSSK